MVPLPGNLAGARSGGTCLVKAEAVQSESERECTSDSTLHRILEVLAHPGTKAEVSRRWSIWLDEPAVETVQNRPRAELP